MDRKRRALVFSIVTFLATFAAVVPLMAVLGLTSAGWQLFAYGCGVVAFVGVWDRLDPAKRDG
jgi:hypothetical protein